MSFFTMNECFTIISVMISGFTLLVLVLTLRKVGEYTKETHTLVLAAQTQTRNAIRPIVILALVGPDNNDKGLAYKNIGYGPAFNIKIPQIKSQGRLITLPPKSLLQQGDIFEIRNDMIQVSNESVSEKPGSDEMKPDEFGLHDIKIFYEDAERAQYITDERICTLESGQLSKAEFVKSVLHTEDS
jgi:hypothetical protein